ncbi:hypothetical protein [Streptomyces sp. NPDC093568]|uniref:hypothetical protein n=1 Tax=Streptomyces sp. NPDC093568 TaxID=3366041 RepID=UPI003827CCC9
MVHNDMPSPAGDPRWWRAPLVATLLGLPVLAWEYTLWGANLFGVLGGTAGWAFVLLALAWLIPRRRSARMLRATVATAAVVCALLPLLLVVMIAVVMVSG